MEYKPFKNIGELEDFLKKSRGKKWKEVNQKGLEEWRVELRKLMFYDRTQLAEASFNKPYTGEYQEKAEELISQLLSERTFSKEELRLLNAYLLLALPEYNNFDKETKMHEDMDKLHKILEKIFKLLKQ